MLRIHLWIVFILVHFACQSPQKPETHRSSDASSFLEGLYINQKSVSNPTTWKPLLDRMQNVGMNLVVIDAQPKSPAKETLDDLKSKGFWTVARIVNFDGGLKVIAPDPGRLASIQSAIRAACQAGFQEIQLDYIRYADGGTDFTLSYEKRYENILAVIQGHKEKSKPDCRSEIKWSADIFGRVPFIENDAIGQKVEPFSKELDALYPMLYPSHFYGITARVADPYTTIKEGIQRTKARSESKTRALAWVQGFKMHIGPSGLSYQDYIKVQMLGAFDAKGDGFVVWNAGNDYEDSFSAYEDYRKEKASRP